MSLVDPFTQLELDLQTVLQSDPEFAYVPVIIESTGDPENQFERALGIATVTGGKSGVVVVIGTLNGNSQYDEVPGPILLTDITAIIRENVPINRAVSGTQQTARALAFRIAQLWHQYYPGSCSGPIVVKNPALERMIPIVENEDEARAAEDFAIYRVNATARILANANVPQVATPFASGLGAHIYNIACATANAQLWFTTDGSNPSPRNGTLITDSFTSLDYIGQTLTVRAWLSGYTPSDKLSLTI